MKTRSKFMKAILAVVAALLYAYGLGYVSVNMYDLAMDLGVYGSADIDSIRGAHSVIVGFLWSLLVLAPLITLFRSTGLLTPALCGIFGYAYSYIIRAIQRDIPLPHSLLWPFEEFQSFLVMASILLCPLLAYGTLKTLLNKFRQPDAAELRRC